jgi:hypothetical protein
MTLKRAAAKGPGRTRKVRLTKLASCIRKTANTAGVPRKFLIDGKSFSTDEYIPEVSAKFTALIEKIKSLDALDMRDHGMRFKHFIFTDIREATYGAKALAGFMVAAGFDLRMGHAERTLVRKGKTVKTKKGSVALLTKEPVMNGCDGFAMLQSLPLWNNPLSVDTKKAILKMYNSRPDNVNGELLRIIILDSKFKEGIDLFDVKYVHLVQPALASSDLKQAVGRATRFCGQRGLRFIPRQGWPLQVYIYNTELPNRAPFELGDDQKVDAHELVLAKSGLDLALINLVKGLTILAISTAVDYDLNFKINNFDVQSAMLEVTDISDITDDMVAEVSQDGGGRKRLRAVYSVDELTPELLHKCGKRKSRFFPFKKSLMVSLAKQFGIKGPKTAKREWYCSQLQANPAYFNALMTTRPTPRAPPRAPPTPRAPPPSPMPSKSSRASPVDANDVLLYVRQLFPSPLPRPSPAASDALRTIDTSLPFNEFQTRIRALYDRFKWASPVIKSGCDAVAALGVGKPVSFTQTQDFVRHYLTPESPFKGLLAWHSVGTGKTCMAVAAATSQFEQAGYTILWVTRNSLMADVYKNIFGSVCSIPIIEHLAVGHKLPTDPIAQKRLLSRAWLAPISYRTFQNALEKQNELGRRLHALNPADPLRKTFLIMDEIHKLRDGDLGPAEAADFGVIQKFIHASYAKSGADSVRPLLMTATPITDSPGELFDIVNTLIPNASDRLVSFDAFREKYSDEAGVITTPGRDYFQGRVKGLISYLNREYDPSTFAQPIFHKVTVPIGEPSLPNMDDLVTKCLALPDELVSVAQDEYDIEANYAQAKALLPSNWSKVEQRLMLSDLAKKYRALKKTASTRKGSSATKAALACFRKTKKAYTKMARSSQVIGMSKCFGKVKTPPFYTSAAFKAAMAARLAGASNNSNIRSSTGAVIDD